MNSETPNQRVRRTERYTAADSEERTYRQPAPAVTPGNETDRNNRVSVHTPDSIERTEPYVMRRPGGSKTQRAKRGVRIDWNIPRPLTAAIIALSFILLMLFTSTQLMKAWLKKNDDARNAAALKIVENHPLMYRELIEKYAADYNLQPSFVAAIIMNESSFRPMAISKDGARGLMQLMEDTAEWIAGKLHTEGYSYDRMYDPESNIEFGCWYLHYLSDLFEGDPICVTAAFHAGQGQVYTWLSDPDLSPDGRTLNVTAMNDGPTKQYIGRVTEDYGIYRVLYFN